MRIEWRTNNAYDSVLVIDDEGQVVQWADADTILANGRTALADMLTAPVELSSWSLDDPDETDPDGYGELVLAREPGDGQADIPDAKLLAERLAFRFGATD